MATRYRQPGTSASKHKPQIFRTKDVRKCLPVMEAIIQDGKPVAIGAEGINISAEGRMTLLQICTWNGRIYVLDLIDADHPDVPSFGRKLLENGRVKAMLESSKVEKVTHSCSNNISALDHQFDIRLNVSQIFDTQAADQALQTLDGTVFPKRKNLVHLVEEYETPEYPLDDDYGTWTERVNEAMGKRPLSEEMIDHVCSHVRMLIPGLYIELYRLLDQKGGWTRYWQMVDWAVNIKLERGRVEEERADAQKDGVRKLFRQIKLKYTPETPIAHLSDDERLLLKVWHKNWDAWKGSANPTVEALEEILHLQFIVELKWEVSHNPPEYRPQEFKMRRLSLLGEHPNNNNIRRASHELQMKVKENREKSISGTAECGPPLAKMGYKQMGSSSCSKYACRGRKVGVVQAEFNLEEQVASDVQGLQLETQIEIAEEEREWENYQNSVGPPNDKSTVGQQKPRKAKKKIQRKKAKLSTIS